MINTTKLYSRQNGKQILSFVLTLDDLNKTRLSLSTDEESLLTHTDPLGKFPEYVDEEKNTGVLFSEKYVLFFATLKDKPLGDSVLVQFCEHSKQYMMDFNFFQNNEDGGRVSISLLHENKREYVEFLDKLCNRSQYKELSYSIGENKYLDLLAIYELLKLEEKVKDLQNYQKHLNNRKV